MLAFFSDSLLVNKWDEFFELCKIFRHIREINKHCLCLSLFSVFIYGKFNSNNYLSLAFCLVFKLSKSGMQIIHLILWLLSSDIFLQVNFNSWSLFRCFPWLVSCTGQACISCHILDLEMFHLRVFSISFSNLFWLGNDTILVCKLYIVYKMKILFLTWPK